MVDPPKEIVFAAGPGQCRPELSVRQSTTHRDDPTHDPKHNQSEPGLQGHELEAKAREHARSNHISDDNGEGGGRSEIGFHMACDTVFAFNPSSITHMLYFCHSHMPPYTKNGLRNSPFR